MNKRPGLLLCRGWGEANLFMCVYALQRFTMTLNGMGDCLQNTKGLSLTEPELTATGMQDLFCR